MFSLRQRFGIEEQPVKVAQYMDGAGVGNNTSGLAIISHVLIFCRDSGLIGLCFVACANHFGKTDVVHMIDVTAVILCSPEIDVKRYIGNRTQQVLIEAAFHR